jgi:ABC transporter substrate binding protein
MRRREFITVLGGAAAWPLAARAQQPERMRRIGVLLNLAENDPEGKARLGAFLQGLQQLGWTIGRNVQIEYRWSAGDPDRTRGYAAELAALAPDVILAEYGLSGKWLELLKQIAPGVTRAAVLRDAAIAAGTGQFGAIQSVAPSFGVELSPVNVRDAGEIERAVTAFARSLNGGLIVTGSPLAVVHRDLIITLAAQHKLPAVYPYRFFVTGGGLISYGPDLLDQFRRAAGYVGRILKGEKPADLPVQAPTKYETVLNLKTAKALGLTVPDTLLARADEVIE